MAVLAVSRSIAQRGELGTGTPRLQQWLCSWLIVWPWTGCAQCVGPKSRFSFDFIFFFSQSQQENICFFYTFLVYLSWDLQLCCCCLVRFNSSEAIEVYLVPKLPGCPCCLFVSSYLASAWQKEWKIDKEKLSTIRVFYKFCFCKPLGLRSGKW